LLLEPRCSHEPIVVCVSGIGIDLKLVCDAGELIEAMGILVVRGLKLICIAEAANAAWSMAFSMKDSAWAASCCRLSCLCFSCHLSKIRALSAILE
jgi:hypothetical protein